MISAGVKDVKNNLSRFLVQVKSGEEVLITERGMPVARIVKEDSGKRLMRAALGRLTERGLIALPSRSLLKDPAPVVEAPGKPFRKWCARIGGERLMILYLDTSALVKRYFRESYSDDMEDVVRAMDKVMHVAVR